MKFLISIVLSITSIITTAQVIKDKQLVPGYLGKQSIVSVHINPLLFAGRPSLGIGITGEQVVTKRVSLSADYTFKAYRPLVDDEGFVSIFSEGSPYWLNLQRHSATLRFQKYGKNSKIAPVGYYWGFGVGLEFLKGSYLSQERYENNIFIPGSQEEVSNVSPTLLFQSGYKWIAKDRYTIDFNAQFEARFKSYKLASVKTFQAFHVALPNWSLGFGYLF